MKNCLIIFTLLFTGFTAKGQIVTIPDVSFKNALLNHDPLIDTNADGEIQESEAEAFIGLLNAAGMEITDLTGIEAFTNITGLFVSTNELTSLDLSMNTSLTFLSCSYNELTSIDISQNILLDEFWCRFNNLTTLDISNNSVLRTVVCNDNQLGSLDITENELLVTLSAQNNEIPSLDLSMNAQLAGLEVTNNQLSALDLTTNPLLSYLDFGHNTIAEIDLTQNVELKWLFVESNPLTVLDLRQNVLLDRLYASNLSITELDVTSLVELDVIEFSGNDLLEIDLSYNTDVCSIDGNDCPMLQYVNVQTGNNINLTNGCINGNGGFRLLNNPVLAFVCVDNIAFAEENFLEVSPTATFIDDCTLNTSEKDIMLVSVHPNPVENVFTIRSEVSLDKLEIHSVIGQLMYGRTLQNKKTETIDISNLPQGTYFVKVFAESYAHVFQVVKR